MICDLRQSCKGFTLIEVLVIVALIGTLAALLLAGFSGMRSKANSAKCLSQMRQIGVMIHLYLGENNQTFFEQGAAGTYDNWIRQLEPYGADEKGAFKCPADKTPARVERTYRFNASPADSGPPHPSLLFGKSYFKVVNPTRKIMVFCVGYEGPAAMPLYKSDTDTWTGVFDKNPTFFEEYPRWHSDKSVNLLFIDGHSEAVKYPVPDEYYHYDRA